MNIYPKLITEALEKVRYPGTGKNIVEAGMVDDNIRIDGNKVSFTLIFEKETDPFKKSVVRAAEASIKAYVSQDVEVTINTRKADKPQAEPEPVLPHVKNIVAVSSGKGGVGKSTVTSNLAVALRNMGYRVGVLDADIYGPSQAMMFGLEGYVPDAENIDGTDYIIPAEKAGIKLISIAMFIRPTDALLWRGTMANSALRQLIHQTKWGGLDFLLIDLPPGTGDIHLSIISELHIDGAVIVSTPQQIAVADVIRGVEMFRNPNVNIPILGIIENMSVFICPHCGEVEHIFGEGGAKRMSEQYGVPLLGELPLSAKIREQADSGLPTVAAEPDGKEALMYREMAMKVAGALARITKDYTAKMPGIRVVND